MTSYTDLLSAGAALPPAPNNALGTWGAHATVARTLGDKLGEWLSVADFGAVGDNSTDNSAAFLALRAYCRLDRTKLYTINFPSGHYLYEDNRWLAHIGSVQLVGNGSTLQCTHTATASRGARPFSAGNPFVNQGDNVNNGTLVEPYAGPLFNTVAAGAESITLTTAAEASYFSVDDYVLLNGYDQQFGGFPPNARFFEWVTVISVDVGTGVIGVSPALQYDYDSRWKDADPLETAGVVYGKPRALNLTRGLTSTTGFIYNPYVGLRDFTLLANLTQPALANGLIISSDILRMENVSYTGGYLWPSINRIVEYTNCKFGQTDLDKFVGELIFDRCNMTATEFGMEGATGCHKFVMTNCKTVDRINIGARKQYISDCHIDTKAQGVSSWVSYYDSYPSSLEFHNNTIQHTGASLYAVNNGTSITLTATAETTGGAIHVDVVTIGDSIKALDYGTLIYRSDYSDAQKVTAIYYDAGNDNWVIEAPWITDPASGNTFFFCSVKNANVSGTKYIGGDRPDFRAIRAGQTGKQVVRMDQGFQLDVSNGITHEPRGYVHGVRVTVVNPYKGAAATPVLEVLATYADDTTALLAVADLLTRGAVSNTLDGTTVTGTNTAVALDPVKVVKTLRVRSNPVLTGAADVMPKVFMTLNLIPHG